MAPGCQQLLPEIDQPNVERRSREDRGDGRQRPDSAPESQQYLHVLDWPPLEHPTHADQAAPTATNDAAILMKCRGVKGQARTVSIVPVKSTAISIGSSPYLSTEDE